MQIDPQRIQAVFLAAAEIIDPAERARFVAGACDGEAELQSRVEVLLHAHDQPDSLLDQPVISSTGPIDDDITRNFASPGSGPGHEPLTREDGRGDNLHQVPIQFLAPSDRPGSLGRIGRYDVLEVLGRGGFGIVFRALDDVLLEWWR